MLSLEHARPASFDAISGRATTLAASHHNGSGVVIALTAPRLFLTACTGALIHIPVFFMLFYAAMHALWLQTQTQELSSYSIFICSTVLDQ